MDRKNSILIVEGDRDILHTLTEGLLMYGYLYEIAFSGEEALQRLRRSHFDVVITDVALSGITSFEVAERVKQLSPDTIVIAMLGFADDCNYNKAIEDASDFIKRPFTVRELLAMIKHTRIQQLLSPSRKFLRSDGCLTIGVSLLREDGGNDGRYNGVERRNNSKINQWI